MNRTGFASPLWGRYTGDPAPLLPKPTHLRLVYNGEAETRPDPMCDYIEGAEWWLARSDFSVRQIQKAFDQQEVACLLYEKTGALADLGREGRYYLIAIQLVRAGTDWDLDVSLSDAGIYLEELMPAFTPP